MIIAINFTQRYVFKVIKNLQWTSNELQYFLVGLKFQLPASDSAEYDFYYCLQRFDNVESFDTSNNNKSWCVYVLEVILKYHVEL